jgi:DNA-directed RNA polymerase subunit H (RpoH/RPB5)
MVLILVKKESDSSKNIEIKKPSKTNSKPKRKIRRQRRLKDQIYHNYISEHILLTDDEVFKLHEKIDIDKLPLILITDPAIKHIEVKAGDIIKIKRNNDTIGTNYYYRKVVKE